MDQIRQILNIQFYDNTIADYAIAIIAFIVVVLLFIVFKQSFVRWVQGYAKKTKIEYDDALIGIVGSIGWPFYLLLAVFVSFQFVVLSESLERVIMYAFVIVAIIYGVWAMSRLVHFVFQNIIRRKKKETRRFDPSVLIIANRLSKLAIWIVGAILVLQVLGLNLTGLLTGIGLTGIAVAFAMRNVLSDMFAYFSVTYNKPFKAGDFIKVGGNTGTVKRIDLISTRLSTLDGSELIIPNATFVKNPVYNYRRMAKRRVEFDVHVGYGTPAPKLEVIPAKIEKIIDSVEHASFKRAHFKDFQDSSLRFEVVYFIDTKNYETFMDTQEKINLEILKVFRKEGIEIPFPTQTVHVEK